MTGALIYLCGMKNGRVHIGLFFSNLIYGINYGVAKAVMPEYIQPFSFIFSRVFFGTILFWLFNAALKTKEKVERKDLPLLALCGFLGVSANQLLFFSGLNLTTPINASLIQTLIPVLVLVVAGFMIKEKITWRKTLGVVTGIVGAGLLITNKGNVHFGNEQFTGDLLIVLNSAFYAFYLVLAKPLMQKYKAQTVIKWVFFFGMLVVVPITAQDFFATDWKNLPAEAWMAIVYVVIFTTFLAYLINTWALKHVETSVVGIYAYLQPLFATVIAVSLGQDTFTLEKGFYSILIFAGVFLVTRPNKKPEAGYIGNNKKT